MEDERETELSTISAIFPELTLDTEDPYTATIELPVTPSNPVSVSFPAATSNLPIANPGAETPEEIHVLSHLPSIHLKITLPSGYPADLPPIFEITTEPRWLSEDKVSKLKADGE